MYTMVRRGKQHKLMEATQIENDGTQTHDEYQVSILTPQFELNRTKLKFFNVDALHKVVLMGW